MELLDRLVVIKYPLPGLLTHFEIVASEFVVHHPLQVAIDQIAASTAQLIDCIELTESSATQSIAPLQLKLNGILNPAVMGGIDNYKSYFTPEYRAAIDEMRAELVDRLGETIAEQMPHLEYGVFVHARRCTQVDEPMHEQLRAKFAEMKAKVEREHGRRPSRLPAHASLLVSFGPRTYVHPRRQNSQADEADKLPLAFRSPLSTTSYGLARHHAAQM